MTKKPTPQFSHDELLTALTDMLSTPAAAGDAGFTFEELWESLSIGRIQLRRLLKKLQREGRLKNLYVNRLAIDGTMRTVPAYGFKQDK